MNNSSREKASFVHLHNHTQYSLLDGACRIDELVETAKQFGMPALAITDHGNMFGAIHFYKKSIKAGLKPIIGMEAYIAPKSRFDKSSSKTGSETAYHLVLLAKNHDGYKNLMKLSSIGYLEGFYYKPRIDKEVLAEHSSGLIVLTSCIKGEIPYKIINGDEKGARLTAQFYHDLFGEDFYLEVQNHGLQDEMNVIKGIMELSREMGIPMVATNDTHYLKREHVAAHDILLCIQTNKDQDDPQRLKFETDQIYFKSSDEMVALFKEIPECLKTTIEITEKCHVVLDFETLHLPHFHLPDEKDVHSLEEYLEKKALEGIKKRYNEITPEIKNRLIYEISVIKRMGYAGYFLIVMDFIEYAHSQEIPVGPGRGSAAGSLVSYALGITDVDPIRYGLLFERFLNPERVTMPDIDIDFCYEKRDKIIEYVKQKYGEKNVTQIITFGSMNARAVVRDVGRVMKIPYSEVDQIAKMIPFQYNLDDALKKLPDFKELCEQSDTYKKLLDYAQVLEGLARHASTHAAGVVITPGELTEYAPLFKSSQGDITTQYDMKSLEDVGLLKMDFLGLRTLTVIDQTVKILRKKGIDLNIHSIPLDDTETYRIFSEGKTISIFQFESSGMREYLKKLQPERIEDLIAMNALYRPGPMEWIDDFINRKQGKTRVEYIHPQLESILKETHGIIVYQEQVMEIASKLAGFSLAKADQLRRAMGKKLFDLMQELRKDFIDGAKSRGLSKDTADIIFDLMDRFAGYGFNKSHATGYSIIAYQTAYLKAHFPVEFMAATLTSEMNNTDRIVVLIEECHRMGITILPPDVNESEADFIAVGDHIRFGLGAIKNVGRTAIESIVERRKNGKPFKTIYDFCQRVNLRLVNKKVLESLIQCGAMDSLEGSRSQKMAILAKAMSVGQSSQMASGSGQTSIFAETASQYYFYPELPQVESWVPAETLRREKELLGFYLSGHPLLKYEDEVNAFASPKIENLSVIQTGQTVKLCGIITEVKNRLDRKEKSMAFFTLEDFTGSVRVVVFSDCYEKYKTYITADKMVLVLGKLDRREDREEITILASELLPIEETMLRFTQGVSLQIELDKFAKTEMDQIKEIIRQIPGFCPLYFLIKKNGSSKYRFLSKKMQVNPTHELLDKLRAILGKKNVWLEG